MSCSDNVPEEITWCDRHVIQKEKARAMIKEAIETATRMIIALDSPKKKNTFQSRDNMYRAKHFKKL